MRAWLQRTALWGPLLIGALLVCGYLVLHQPLAADETELRQVPLSEEDPTLDRVGDLKYLGGLDVPRMDQNIGGLSGLRWDADSQRLLAITDDARWVWITLEETEDQLTGISKVESGPLLGVDGEPLTGKQEGDSEGLTRDGDGPWGVSFERNHRILIYDNGLSGQPGEANQSPTDYLGDLEPNNGAETIAAGKLGHLVCAERVASNQQPNCAYFPDESSRYRAFSVLPSQIIADLGGVPTDADAMSDGTFLVLFRSYSPAQGNGAAIVSYAPGGTRRELATFRPPLSVDNFEGLAIRQEGERTFLYIVSDDNFSGSQRTLLMKFELDL
ncbi:MAG: esterase-like activity of phytase family protein [Erythrobacter sp.]